MKPYGREKTVKASGTWKKDVHPGKGYINWWESMCDFLTRSKMKRIYRRDMDTEIYERELRLRKNKSESIG